MNFRMILKSLGIVLCIEAACMIPAFIVSLIYGEKDSFAFVVSMIIILICGFFMYRVKAVNKNIYARDGFAIVAFGWLLISFFGALPFIISGAIPSLTDAFFECSSGFSTTGASILKNIEELPRGILFWRSFTHWIGGMGILVLFLAILPSVGATTFHILKAESPGPTPGKIVPKIGQTAKILYAIYISLTSLEVVFLLISGMSLYDALIHAFGTAGTGGFSVKNASIGAYNSPHIEWIITVFMLMFGVNFALYYQVIKGNFKSILRNEELRFYLGTVVVAIIFITINLNTQAVESVSEGIRHSAFQVSSIITTTGYSTANFNLWPVFSKFLLIILMFIGASAGSTGGGMKCIRIVLLLKIVKREIAKIIHPRSIHAVKVGDRSVEEETLSGIMAFFFLYMFIIVLSVLIISLDGKDIVTSVTAVIATISNIGPGLEAVGPIGNYSEFSILSKWVLSLDMIIGRLELYPVLLLFTPTFWKRVNI